MTSRVLMLCMAAMILVACDDMRALLTLQEAIEEEFGETASLDIENGRILTVTFENSPSVARDSAGLRERAHGIATFVRSHHPRANELRTIKVVFTSVTSGGPVTVTRTQGEFSWQLGELRTVASDSVSPPPATP